MYADPEEQIQAALRRLEEAIAQVRKLRPPDAAEEKLWAEADRLMEQMKK